MKVEPKPEEPKGDATPEVPAKPAEDPKKKKAAEPAKAAPAPAPAPAPAKTGGDEPADSL